MDHKCTCLMAACCPYALLPRLAVVPLLRVPLTRPPANTALQAEEVGKDDKLQVTNKTE
jgi:hypothetical protein